MCGQLQYPRWAETNRLAPDRVVTPTDAREKQQPSRRQQRSPITREQYRAKGAHPRTAGQSKASHTQRTHREPVNVLQHPGTGAAAALGVSLRSVPSPGRWRLRFDMLCQWVASKSSRC